MPSAKNQQKHERHSHREENNCGLFLKAGISGD
jgi:hypothetical protein